MPLLWLRGFLLASCWIIGRSSPTPGAEGHSAAPDCPSCALAALPKDGPNSQPEMVEAVKKHILNMLHLKKRPEVTQPVPKAALLNAIRKLHVGKVGENGFVEIEDDIGRRAELNELMEQTSEIITFAESAQLPANAPGKAGVHMDNSDGVPGPWLQPGSTLDIATIWRVMSSSFVITSVSTMVAMRRGNWRRKLFKADRHVMCLFS